MSFFTTQPNLPICIVLIAKVSFDRLAHKGKAFIVHLTRELAHISCFACIIF